MLPTPFCPGSGHALLSKASITASSPPSAKSNNVHDMIYCYDFFFFFAKKNGLKIHLGKSTATQGGLHLHDRLYEPLEVSEQPAEVL